MRGVIWLLGILLFVWLGILAGPWLLIAVIMNITIPITGWWGTFFNQAFKIVTSVGLAVAWLWLWIKIEYAYFWRTIKKATKDNA
jgi:hypothetical protein